MSNDDATRAAPGDQQPKPGDLSPRTKAALEAYREASMLDDDFPAELEEPACSYCDDDGGDPMNDYVLPCPHCGGFR